MRSLRSVSCFDRVSMLLLTPSLACEVSDHSVRSAEARVDRINFEGIVMALVDSECSGKCKPRSIVAKHRRLGSRCDGSVIRQRAASVAYVFVKH